MLLFRLWWLQSGLSFSRSTGFSSMSSSMHWFAELGGMPGPQRVRCSMHINKAVICIAGSSFALQLSVPVRVTSSQLCYSQPSTIQLIHLVVNSITIVTHEKQTWKAYGSWHKHGSVETEIHCNVAVAFMSIRNSNAMPQSEWAYWINALYM